MYKSISRIAAALAFGAFVTSSWAVTAEICLDPGHGGTDPGATNGCYGGSNYEKTNVLNTDLKFRTWMTQDTNDGAGGGSWATVMTRSTDVYISLQGRCDVSNNNGCNRFMSMHNNAFNCSANGTSTYSYSSTGTGATLRNQVQSRMLQAWGRYNRGNATASFYVLVNTAAPAILAELAFVDAPVDNPYCSGSTNQNNAAKYHLFAIQNHYGITAYTPGTGAVTYTDDTPTASANWTVGTSATDKYGADYKFRATAALSDAAAFSASIATAGNYDISAWWTAGTNRSAAAPYIMPDSATVNVNQQVNGGKWNLLGTKSLATGTKTVSLSCWAATGFVVVADAVKFYGPK